MPGQLQATVVGLQNIEGKLRHLPVVMRPFFERAAKYGQDRMKEYAKPQHSGPPKLAEGVGIDIRGTGGSEYSLSAHIGFLGRGFGMRSSLGAIAPTVNYGRNPGRPPSIKGIHRWLRLVGAHVSPRGVQQQIAARGTKGKRFLEQAAEDLSNELPQLVRETELKIRARWG